MDLYNWGIEVKINRFGTLTRGWIVPLGLFSLYKKNRGCKIYRQTFDKKYKNKPISTPKFKKKYAQ